MSAFLEADHNLQAEPVIVFSFTPSLSHCIALEVDANLFQQSWWKSSPLARHVLEFPIGGWILLHNDRKSQLQRIMPKLHYYEHLAAKLSLWWIFWLL